MRRYQGPRRWSARRQSAAKASRPPDENLLRRRPLYGGALLLFLVSIIVRQPLLFVTGVLVLALAIIPELWYRFGLRALEVERQPAVRHAIFGDLVEVPLVVENRKLLPMPWVEIEDEFPDQLPVLGMRLLPAVSPERAILVNTMALWAFERVRRRYRLRAVERGVFRFGPTTIRATDPFGILTREIRQERQSSLLVYPLVVPLARFGLPARAPFGEHTALQRLLEDPLRIVGVRDYAPGDEPRRIHWKATARMGTLQSKVYDPATRHTLMIFLDIHSYPDLTMGYDPELLELAVCAAASVASWALDEGYAVGIGTNGTLATFDVEENGTAGSSAPPSGAARAGLSDEELARALARGAQSFRMRLPPSPRPEQLGVILQGLARLLPFYGARMAQILSDERFRLPPGATVVYIGAERIVDDALIVALRQLQRTGHAVTLMLTAPDGAETTAAVKAAAERAERSADLAGLRTYHLGGGARWQALRDEALGGMPPRRASPFGGTPALAQERQALQSFERRRSPSSPTDESERPDDIAAEDSGAWLRPSAVHPWTME